MWRSSLMARWTRSWSSDMRLVCDAHTSRSLGTAPPVAATQRAGCVLLPVRASLGMKVALGGRISIALALFRRTLPVWLFAFFSPTLFFFSFLVANTFHVAPPLPGVF